MLGEGTVTDEIHLVGPRMLVVNKTPAVWSGRVDGLGDHASRPHRLEAISGELDSAKGLADAALAKHEAATGCTRSCRLSRWGGPRMRSSSPQGLDVAQQLTDQVMAAVDEPVLAAVLLGKSAQAQERGIDFAVDSDSRVSDLAIEPSAVVTMVGNLVDRAMDAAAETEPPHGWRSASWPIDSGSD